jgi:dethiobiotin synthetase
MSSHFLSAKKYSMGKIFFITGTDTNIGKTYITVGLLKKFKSMGMRVLGIKPIATGSLIKNHIYCNTDALLLQKHATQTLSYNQINPFPLILETAPSIAATNQNIKLTTSDIIKEIVTSHLNNFDYIFIEGIGGWQVPINAQETMADLIKILNIPTILVIGIKLGCLNHAILTYKDMLTHSLPWLGMVGNCCDSSMEYIDEYIITLKQFINIPYLGTIKYQEPPEKALDITPLTEL